MRRKIGGMAAAITCLLLFLTPATASAQGSDPVPANCLGMGYSVLFGEGIAVTCGFPPRGGSGYAVVAHCTTGDAFWLQVGSFVPYGYGPSVAECSGSLLHNAWVAGYHVTGI